MVLSILLFIVISLIKRRIAKIRVLLSKEQTEILETALLLMIPSLLTKLSGLFFNLIAASYFGTRQEGWNQFLIASAIPEMLTNIFLIGTLGSVVVPTLISCKKKEGTEEFKKVYNSIVNLSILIFSIIALILIFTARQTFPFMLSLVEPNVEVSPQDYNAIINMMRVLFIPQVVLGASVFISSALNVYNRYLVPQLAPLFYNVGRIAMLFILVPLMNYSPWAIVIGVFVGSFLHLAVQLPLVFELKLNYIPVLSFTNKYVKEILTVGLPRIFAIASEHIAFTFNKFLAFGITGNLAALTYANSLSLVIPSLFGYTFAVPAFTVLSEFFEEKDHEKAHSVIIKTLNEMLFLSLPFIISFLVLRVPIVRLVFGLIPKTNFALEDTTLTAWILLWFTVGHIFVCGRWFMYRVFYAAKDTMVPFLVSFVSLFVTVILSVLFTNLFSHNTDFAISLTNITLENFLTRDNNIAALGGIAFAMSIAYSLEFFALMFIFSKTKFKIRWSELINTTLPKFVAGGVMIIVMYSIYKIWNIFAYSLPVSATEGYLGSTTLNLIFLTGTTIVTSFMVYYLVSFLLRVEELRILRKYLNPIFRIGGLRIN